LTPILPGRNPKSYRPEDLRRVPAKDWPMYEKQLRKGIQLRVDTRNYLVVVKRPGFSGNHLKMTHIRGRASYANHHDIFEFATHNGITPEFLVDADYYTSKSYMSPYRVLFGACRKGMTLWDFYLKVLEHGVPLVPDTFMRFFRGDPKILPYITLDALIVMCRLVDIAPVELFASSPKINKDGAAVFASLKEALSAMDDKALAALSGIAMALAFNRENARGAINDVLSWLEGYGGDQTPTANRAL